jgi:hypothetical protein
MVTKDHFAQGHEGKEAWGIFNDDCIEVIPLLEEWCGFVEECELGSYEPRESLIPLG